MLEKVACLGYPKWFTANELALPLPLCIWSLAIKKPADSGSGSVSKLFLHTFGMRWCCTDFLRTAYWPHKSLMRHEGMPAFDVSALVVAFFGFVGNLEAASGMCRLSAHRTIHHNNQPSLLTSSQLWYIIVRNLELIIPLRTHLFSPQTQYWLWNHYQRWQYAWVWWSSTRLHQWAA